MDINDYKKIRNKMYEDFKKENPKEYAKLKDGKRTRQITRRAQWTDKSRVVKDLAGKIRYITYYDLDQLGYRCAVGKIWLTLDISEVA